MGRPLVTPLPVSGEVIVGGDGSFKDLTLSYKVEGRGGDPGLDPGGSKDR